MSKRKPKRKPKQGKPAKAPAINGVLLERGEDGFNLTPLGDVKATELPTLLRQAAKAAETALGID